MRYNLKIGFAISYSSLAFGYNTQKIEWNVIAGKTGRR